MPGADTETASASPYPGIRRRSLDTAFATVVEYTFEAGARFPMHQHPQEQITVLRRGEVELTAGGRVSRLGPGEWSVVAGGVEHGIIAGRRGASFLAILVPRRGPDEVITLTDTTETGARSR